MKSSDLIPEVPEQPEERRVRTDSNNPQYQTMNVEMLLNLLKETKSLHDEADILHFLYEAK